MRRIGRNATAVLVGLGLVFGLAVSSPQDALADSKPDCVAQLQIKDAPNAEDATKDPVLFVHGLGSSGDTWSEGKPSMHDALAGIDGIKVVDAFDYKASNDRWVTDGDTAQRLAKTVVCYSKLYDNKHVTLVVHSMGGLLVREMLDWAAYGTFAKKVVGHIVTIGTPHTGSILANADSSFWMALCKAPIGIFSLTEDIDSLCRQADWGRATAGLSINSDQLAELPKFPRGISVKAIAGNAQLQTCALWGCSERSTDGDLVVSVKSATAEYTDTGVGDGKKVFTCTTFTLNPLIADAWCEHSHMLQAPKVQAEVKASIKAYLASVRSKAGTPHEFFGDMTLYLKSDLKVQSFHGEGPSAYDVACVDKAACPSFSVYSPNEVGGDLGWKSWDLPECGAGQDASTFGPIIPKGTRKIGGKSAKYYEAELCAVGVSRETTRFWEATDGSIFVSDTSGNNRWQSDEDKILSAATWR
jgi:pimeloyl-ACP methyl ester carboxylesterase